MSNLDTARPIWIQLLFFTLLSLAPHVAVATKAPVVTSKIEGDFFDVAHYIRAAIIGKGIKGT